MTTQVPGFRNFEVLAEFFDSPFTVETALADGTCVRGYFDADNVIADGMVGPTVVIESRHVAERSIDYGDILTIDGRTYRIEGIRPDGTGLSELVMVQT